MTGVRFTTKYGRSSGLIIFVRFVPIKEVRAIYFAAPTAGAWRAQPGRAALHRVGAYHHEVRRGIITKGADPADAEGTEARAGAFGRQSRRAKMAYALLGAS